MLRSAVDSEISSCELLPERGMRRVRIALTRNYVSTDCYTGGVSNFARSLLAIKSFMNVKFSLV